MTRYLRLLSLLILLGASAAAQRSTFYWLADAGGRSAAGRTAFRAGLAGGGEVALGKGFSAGPEIGLLAPREGRFWRSVHGLGSLNVYYHFRHGRGDGIDPFVTAGYAVLFRNATEHMFQYGGGFNYWVREDIALRTEFRDRTFGTRPGTAHLWTFRVGISFTHLFP